MAKSGKLSKKQTSQKKVDAREARLQRKKDRRAERVAAGEIAPRPKRSLLSSTNPEQMNKPKPHSGLQRPIPPPALFDLMHNFLKDYNYVKAAHGMRTDNQKRPGHNLVLWRHKGDGYPALIDIFTEWEKAHPQMKLQEIAKDTESEDASDDESSDSSSSDDDAMSVNGGTAVATGHTTTTKNHKRKASESSSSSATSSSSESSESESNSEDEVEKAPAAKKAKTAHTETPLAPVTAAGSSSSSSEADSDDDGSSTSSSEAGVPVPTAVEAAAAVPLPSSSAESSSEASESDASSDDDSDGNESSKKPTESQAVARTESDSSATLPISGAAGSASSASSFSSTSSSSESSDEEVPPAAAATAKQKKQQELLVYHEPVSKTKRKRDPSAIGEEKVVPATAQNFKKLKKGHIPFSRIPADIQVDDKFSSNKYVPYEYADKAHQNLIVTKGKGFTKAKNKGKRGSYKGGPIDTAGVRAIKFDD